MHADEKLKLIENWIKIRHQETVDEFNGCPNHTSRQIFLDGMSEGFFDILTFIEELHANNN